MTRIDSFVLMIAAPATVIVPLLLACLAILIAIPFAAARGKLHVPGYVGFAGLTFLLALLAGWLSGLRAVTGTVGGFVLAILCFLLAATAVGCVLALFFHRQTPQA